MIRPAWMGADHIAYGETVRRFLAEQFEPHRAEWTKAGQIGKEFWHKAGDLGLLGASVPEEYGGSGLSRSFDLVTFTEQDRIGDTGWTPNVHGIVAHYLMDCGTEDQRRRWLPKLVSGEWVGAIAMTEPGTGSDLQAIRATALKAGDEYIINGQKTFISNGATCDFIIVVVKTDPSIGGRGISLIGVELDGLAGFNRGRVLDKVGMDRQDTSELSFDDVRVPTTNLLGGIEGKGFGQLMTQLPWERLAVGVHALAASHYALEETLAYVKERRAFGKRLMDQQNIRFRLAEAASEIEIFGAFIDGLVAELDAGTLTPDRAAMAKYWGSEMQCRIIDDCVQMHGGYGYMNEYRIAERWRDARVQRIYGGANEIMRELIARSLDRE